MRRWYARIVVAVAIAAGLIELAIACRGLMAFVLWVTRGGNPAEPAAPGFVGMVLAAPVFALVALGWFTLFTARAARRGIEDGFLGVAAALALSLGVVHFVAPPVWLAGALAIAVVGGALTALVTWRGARTQL